MIKNTVEVIHAFSDRYMEKYVIGTCVSIIACDDKVAFTFVDCDNRFVLYAWIVDGELHIENESRQSVFDFVSEMEWTDWDVLCIKFGEEKAAEYIRENDALNVMKTALYKLREAWFECRNSFYTCKVDCNKYIAEHYPFDKSFGEIEVNKWVLNSVAKINADLK